MFRNFFLTHTVYEVKWKNILEPGRPQMTIRCIRIVCWVPKATSRHSVYVIFIAFLLQQWLQERTYLPVLLGIRSSAAEDSVFWDVVPRQWVIICPLTRIHILKWRHYQRNYFWKFGLAHLTKKFPVSYGCVKFISLPLEPDPHYDLLFI
jgi:hypothetical protein